jgi:hypothetical protein
MSVSYINYLNVGYKTGQPRGIAPTDLYQTFFKRYNANGLISISKNNATYSQEAVVEQK